MSGEAVELHVVSDSTGETAARLAQAVEAQFPDELFEVVRHPRVASVDDVQLAAARARGRRAVVMFTLVEPEDVERWGTTVEELHELALLNLLRQTNEEEPLLCEPSGNQKLCGWSSSDGYDATRMIVPELRRQIVREYGGPAVYAVPMENVFVALPEELVSRGKTEELFRRKVDRDFQTSKDPLSPEVFVERDGELALFR